MLNDQGINMDIGIDMLKVGKADAMIVWLKNKYSSVIMVIDGGNEKDGNNLIKHLRKYILPHVKQNAPDIIINTHPDRDHIGGLFKVVEYYKNSITCVFIHDPQKHDIQYDLIKSSLKKVASIHKKSRTILASLQDSENFLQLVDKYKIRRLEPFPKTFSKILPNILNALGPSEDYYEELLSGFHNVEQFVSKLRREELRKALLGESKAFDSEDSSSILDEENEVSPENNSSLVFEINVNSRKYLFTGDAGVDAFLDIQKQNTIKDIHWLKIPHHGSRRNLTSSLIKTMSPRIAYISAEGSRKHPRKALVNYLKRNSAKVYSTHKNGNIWHHRGNFPEREEYSTAEPL